MVSVLVLLNEISSTSIPFETAVQAAEQSSAEITIVSFYDDAETQYLDMNVPVQFGFLGANSRLDPVAWQRLYRELRTGSYDVLHTHQNFTGSVARALASATGVSIVNTEHRQHSSFTALQNVVNAPTLPLADSVVFNSTATRNSLRWYEKLLLNDDRLSVVYNGIDVDRLDHIAESVSGDNPNPKVVTVGRHVPVKNYVTLLEAFALVREEVPDATLSLVGDGPLRDKLEARAETLDIADTVRFTGEISRADVYRELARADLFTIPSHSEGFCVAAVEAMAAGLPVVVSDIDVFHEVVGDCGVFAVPDEPDAFAEAITTLLQNPDRAEHLGKQAKQRARSRFSLEQTACEYYNIYKQVAETRKQ